MGVNISFKFINKNEGRWLCLCSGPLGPVSGRPAFKVVYQKGSDCCMPRSPVPPAPPPDSPKVRSAASKLELVGIEIRSL